VSFPGVDAVSLTSRLDERGLSIYTGSACQSGRPSLVLEAMGLPPEQIHSAVRISLGVNTTETDILHAAKLILAAVREFLAGV
jgi:cysteine desulfurase